MRELPSIDFEAVVEKKETKQNKASVIKWSETVLKPLQSYVDNILGEKTWNVITELTPNSKKTKYVAFGDSKIETLHVFKEHGVVVGLVYEHNNKVMFRRRRFMEDADNLVEYHKLVTPPFKIPPTNDRLPSRAREPEFVVEALPLKQKEPEFTVEPLK